MIVLRQAGGAGRKPHCCNAARRVKRSDPATVREHLGGPSLPLWSPILLPFDAELRIAFDDDLFASQLSCSHADAGFRGRGLHKISHHLLAGLKANMITAPPRR